MYMYGCWALAIIVKRYPVSEGSKYFLELKKKNFQSMKTNPFL